MPKPKRRILLVEDDPDVGDVFHFALVAAGYAVESVQTAEAARHLMEQVRYDLVISDWRLRAVGDGMLVLDHAAEQGIKTILISGYLFQLSDADSRHEYLMKPVRSNELIATVERLLAMA